MQNLRIHEFFFEAERKNHECSEPGNVDLATHNFASNYAQWGGKADDGDNVTYVYK